MEEIKYAHPKQLAEKLNADTEVVDLRYVVDLAWKAEGLKKILEVQGQRVELKDLLKAYDIALLPPCPGTDPIKIQKETEWACKTLDALARRYKYDSGKRRL